jgi:hypothetical protein
MQSRSDRANAGTLFVGNFLVAETMCVQNQCLPLLLVQLIHYMIQLIAKE